MLPLHNSSEKLLTTAVGLTNSGAKTATTLDLLKLLTLKLPNTSVKHFNVTAEPIILSISDVVTDVVNYENDMFYTASLVSFTDKADDNKTVTNSSNVKRVYKMSWYSASHRLTDIHQVR